MTRTRVLITGFEAFGEHESNPTEWLARQLDGRHDVFSDGLEIEWSGIVLPVNESGSRRVALGIEAGDINASLVLHTGLSGRARGVKIERRAVNTVDMPIADNDGRRVDGRPIHEGSPAALHPAADRALLEALAERCSEATARPAELSDDAGTYVCNETYYRSLDALRQSPLAQTVDVLFVHLPSTEYIAHEKQLAAVVEIARLLLAHRSPNRTGAA